jgi:signal transduction histidine kinase
MRSARQSRTPRVLSPVVAAAGRPAVLDSGLSLLLVGLSLLAGWSWLFPGGNKKLQALSAGTQATDAMVKAGQAAKAAASVAAQAGYSVGSSGQTARLMAFGWLALIVVEVACLPLRRRFPLVVLLATVALATAHSALLPLMPAPGDLAVAVAVCGVATTLPRAWSVCCVTAAVALSAAVDTRLPPGSGKEGVLALWGLKPVMLIVPALALAAAWLAGDNARTRRAYLAAVEQRARDAERDRDRMAELAVAAERERITRELHDVVAHALSVMVVQAQGADSALRRDRAAQAGQALDAIVATGRGALAEARRVLGAMGGQPESAAGPALAGIAPQPRLADVPGLAESFRQAGTPVTLRVTGSERPLPPGIELAAYRIVQEALTNTMRHAGTGAAASVHLGFRAADLLVEITDDGDMERGPAARGTQRVSPDEVPGGHGIAGMRARVALLGGSLAAGPGQAGGFAVRAVLPADGEPADREPADREPADREMAERGGP